jgi:hypothetical protein
MKASMEDQGGGWLWMLIDVGFVAVLGAVLIYGTMQWKRRRSRPVEHARDQATHQLYESEERRREVERSRRVG